MKGTETGTAEKEYSGDCHHKKVDNNYGDGYHGINDDSFGSSIEDDDDDGRYLDIGDDGVGNRFYDICIYSYNSSDDHIDRELPPPSHSIAYYGDSVNLRAAYSFSQDRVELFAVRPRFHFVGTLVATNGHSYYWSSQKEQDYQSVDFKDNLIFHLEGGALMDTFWVKIKILQDDGSIGDVPVSFSFTVDPYDCNNVMTRIISLTRNRKMELTFMALHSAIQANVYVNLDFTSSNATRTGTIYYVYGEITAHHQLYNGRSVLLFSRGEENKAEVIDGELPLLRKCAVVPIYLEPLLILKFDLHVPINCDHDDGGCTIAFRDYVTFYRDQYEEKIICSANHAERHHGEVKVRITYQ
ncbi:uncharacterized protein [Triticum aestivum]|nr:uncharacterized protein LOC123047587 isoform X2 [Triticum aestivum]